MAIMAEGGKKLQKVMRALVPQVKAGITTKAIDREAERLIRAEGAEPSFKKVPGFFWTTCLPINEQVVHTPPSSRILKEGDVLTIDIGLFHKGFHVDYAITLIIGGHNKETNGFLEAGKEALDKAIKEVKAGAYLGKVSQTIENVIHKNNYFTVRALTGHGIGRQLHEDPYVPGYLDKSLVKTPKMKPGLVIAIEVIYSKGTEEIKNEKGNDWSIISADRSLTACFEHTVALTGYGAKVLT